MKDLHFNNIKIRNKLLMIYFISVFLPIVLTNIIFYYVTSENVKEQKRQDNELALTQIFNSFKQGVEDAAGVASILYSDPYVSELLSQDYESPIGFIHAYNKYFRDINKYSPVYSTIRSIHLYTDNSSVITAGGIFAIDPSVEGSYWYTFTNEKRKHYPAVTTIMKEGKRDHFAVVRDQNTKDSLYENIIMIHLNQSFIELILNNATFEGNLYLINDNGIIEYSNDSGIEWEDQSLLFEDVAISDRATIIRNQYHTQYLNNWTLVGVLSENNLIDQVRESRFFILYLAIWNFIIPSMFIIYMTGNIHLRLNKILKKMRQMKNQNFEIIKGEEYKDEIGVLTTEYNRMAMKIKDLIQDVYLVTIQKKDVELQKKEAQLKALQSQINPHFLFNVLETIRMRSVLKEENETASIIQNLAQLLRNSFTWGRDWVLVKEEVQLIESFLNIQQYRFGDKMSYSIYLPEEVENMMIPHMIIIPFVENASIHGIEPVKEKGKIDISFHLDKDLLTCMVSDTGIGIKEEKYRAIIQSLTEEEITGDSIGIKNVYQRLKFYYGERFDFSLESSYQHGTEIKLSIPLFRQAYRE